MRRRRREVEAEGHPVARVVTQRDVKKDKETNNKLHDDTVFLYSPPYLYSNGGIDTESTYQCQVVNCNVPKSLRMAYQQLALSLPYHFLQYYHNFDHNSPLNFPSLLQKDHHCK